MIALDVEEVRKHFGPEPVLDGVTFAVHPGERIALIGPNGCGKSTLLGLIAGRIESEAGSITLHPSVHLDELRQQVRLVGGRSLYDEAKQALADLVGLEQEAIAVAEQIAAADDDEDRGRLAARYDHLQHELQRRDAYNLDHKVRRVLTGLGFAESTFNQPVESLSGGEQNRLMLGRLLLAEPNLMLLDEPSNHLDIAATEWLEDWLIDSSAAMLVVSHDRQLLDRVATRTLELIQGTVDSYAGNYSAYCRQKEERLLVQRRTYEKQQTEIAKTREFIRRNAYGQKHAQAEDRRKKLERIEPAPPPREIQPPPMAFPPVSRSGDIVLRTENLGKAYERTLFAGLSFEMARGQRWGLIGPNGSGKTTLLRCIVGLERSDRGITQLGHNVRVGYFDQHLTELHDSVAAHEAIRPPGRRFETQQRRDLLARFGVTGDTALQSVGRLSGGERCRVALARLAAAEANLLVLDEPTNHLDIWARDSLQRALRRFDGTVLLVSHDRYFVNHVVDHLLVIEPDGVRVVEGNYDTYRRLRANRETTSAEEGQSNLTTAPEEPRRADSGTNPPGRRQRRFPYRKVADLEADILECETAIQQFHAELADGATHRDGDLVRHIKQQIELRQAALAELYEHWEEAVELNW